MPVCRCIVALSHLRLCGKLVHAFLQAEKGEYLGGSTPTQFTALRFERSD